MGLHFMSFPFEEMNEQDVREEIIAPLLRMLGYRSGTENNIVRELPLRYPRVSLGRKSRAKDPELRGKADYLLEVHNRLRWVIEAKAPSSDITEDDVEQAFSYAKHCEVRAVYFALCNGRLLNVYRTDHSPEAGPILSIPYAALDDKLELVSNVLGPVALMRDFPDVEVDYGIPLAPGLRSVARITNGVVRYEKNSVGVFLLNEFQMNIRNGGLQRDEVGHLVAFLKMGGPLRSLEALNDRLGLSRFEMTSTDCKLSLDSRKPTLFVYDNRVILPKGESILDLASGRNIELPVNFVCNVRAEASGTYHDHVFSGVFSTTMQYLGVEGTVSVSGTFELHLS